MSVRDGPKPPNDPVGPRLRPIDPRLTSVFTEFEESHPAEEVDLTTLDLILFISRCAIVLLFLITYVIVLVNVARGTRLKNWRLYTITCLAFLCWLVLGLYQDHIDEYFVHAVYRVPQSRSIYWCFRNLLHGITLYLIILLLSHLSDFQHRGVWLWLVASVVVAPLIYSIFLLIVDLRVHPDSRNTWQWNVGIETFRVFLYNVITTVLLVVFLPRFCTSRLYGTYEESRSPIVVLLSRWTYAFYLLHNLVAIASYSAFVAGKVSTTHDPWTLSATQRSLDEIAFLLMVIAIPVSYIVAVCGHCCCEGRGSSTEVEMDKMDKIYQEVWTTNQDQRRKGRNGSVVNTDPEPGQGRRANRPASSSVTTSPNGSASNVSRTTEVTPADKRRKRESYFEAVSMGSLDDRSSIASRNSSVTSEPIDL